MSGKCQLIITDEHEIKILFELLEKRNEQQKSTIDCSQRDPQNCKCELPEKLTLDGFQV